MSQLTYDDVIQIPTFMERFKVVSQAVKESDIPDPAERAMKQRFYQSKRWMYVRDYCVARDKGLDLAFPGIYICGPVYVHHLLPVTASLILSNDSRLLDPDFLISCSKGTHEALPYGTFELIYKDQYLPRSANEIPWR